MSHNPLITTPLTAADVDRYQVTGILFPIRVLESAELQKYRTAVDELEAHLGPGADRTLYGECHLTFKWAYDLSTHPRVLDVVEQLIGPDILVHSTTLFSKPPGKSYVSWHQDSPYWHLSKPRLVSAWIALSESTTENGCLRVQPGSHLTELQHIEVRHEDNMLGTGNTVREGFDESLVVDVVLRPGQMSLHHAHLLHGSNPNRSSGKRIGFAVRYVAPEVRQGRGHQRVVLARGQDRYGHFESIPEPPGYSVRDGLPVHLAFTEQINRRGLDKDGPG